MVNKQQGSSETSAGSNLVSYHVDDQNVLTLLDYMLQMNMDRFIVERGDKEWRVTVIEKGNEAKIATLTKVMSNKTPRIILAS